MADPVVPDTFEDGGGDQNTDPEVVTLEESQATDDYAPEETGYGELEEPPVELNSVDESENPDDQTPTVDDQPATSEGVGAKEDSGAASTAKTAKATNAGGNANANDKITPQPNVLDRFVTYNYQASVYLMSPKQYKTYMDTGKRTVNGYNLLFQSGGAPNNVGGAQGGNGSNASGRNPFFPNDFYIDSITLNNSLFGKSTNAAHSVAELKFTVIEPANITLIDCLYNAVQDMKPEGAKGVVNYAAAVYLMVIRFYGQDINGKIQQVGAADPNTGLSDPNAMVEKFIPFKIKEIKFSIGSKVVSYEFDCAPTGQMVGNGTRRGTIPADLELTATTVSSLLTGTAQYSTVTAPATAPGAGTAAPNATDESRDTAGSTNAAPPKANNAPNNKKVIKSGLITAMNEAQQQLVKDKIYEQADVYELEFAEGAEAIRDGKIAKPDKTVNKSSTAMAAPASKDPSQSSPDKNSVDSTTRNWAVTAGMQMVQVIDMIIRNSSYISDQALTLIDEKTDKQVANPNANTKGIKWFNILMSATQLAYDNERNDFAYKIKYTIVPYVPTDFQSAYFPLGKFRGVHKKYSWWFTGMNTQVLDYSASFNKLYSLTVTGSTPQNSALAMQRKNQTSSNRDMPFVQYQARSTESAFGADGKANELAASAAEYLYNPSDNANAKVRIIGDPAWIQQGSLSGVFGVTKTGLNPFLPDGTINFDVNDVLFELTWQKPEDYDLNTGLADPYAKTQKTVGDRSPVQNVLYRVKSVVSEFKQGRFEQTLDATLYQYPTPAAASKSGAAGSTAKSAAATDSQTSDEGLNADMSDSERTPLEDQTTVGDERISGDQYADGENGRGYGDYSEAARLEQLGDTGAMVEPDVYEIPEYAEDGLVPDDDVVFPDDSVSPAEADAGVESNGEEISTDGGAVPPPSGRITESQRAEINQTISTFEVELNPVIDRPQIIARDW